MYQCGQCEKAYVWPNDLHRHVKHKNMVPDATAPAAAAAAPHVAAAALAATTVSKHMNCNYPTSQCYFNILLR